MKRFANYILTSAFLLAAGGAGMKTQAQNDADLLRFSMMNPIGTSRFNAMGGAFGALGANFSSLSTNPAGIGLYTRHEISLTGGLLAFSSIGDYYGQSAEIDNVRVTFPQGGGIFEVYNNKKSEGGLRRLQFGFGANRIKDFNSCSYIRGTNTQSSYMEYVTAVSDGYDFGGADENLAHVGTLAYRTGLMDYADNTGYNYISFLGPGLEQKHILQEKGNISELVFSFGGNVADKLYFGATLGVPIVNYQQVSIIEETNWDGIESDYIPAGLEYFDSYRLKQDLKQTGSGVNLKLGLIFKPVDFLRIGLAFHTPTYYNLKERSTVSINTNMLYVIDSVTTLPNSDAYSYDDIRYSISTPAKGILSLGFLIQNFGAVSVEGELINYRGMRFDMDDLDEQSYMRDVVRQNYKMAGVVRVGTEWKVGIVSLRAGYIWQSCPYRNEDLRRQWSDHTVTAGIGLALGRHCNLDFAFMGNFGKRTDDFYYLVDQNNNPLVQPGKVYFSKYLYTLGFSSRF